MILIFMVGGARAELHGWWGDDLDLHGWWGEGGDFFLHTISNTREHGSTSRKYGVGIQVLTDVDVALHDGVVGGLVDTSRFHTDEGRLEQGFGASESFVTDCDNLSVRKFVGFLQTRAACCSLHLLFEVKSNITELLFNVSDEQVITIGIV